MSTGAGDSSELGGAVTSVTCAPAPQGIQFLWTEKGSHPTEQQMVGKFCSFVHPNFYIFGTMFGIWDIIVERFKKQKTTFLKSCHCLPSTYRTSAERENEKN